MRPLTLLLPAALSACALTSDAFAERYGAQTCDWLETCDGSTVDRDACLAEQADGVDALLALDGCSYDEDAARDCLDQREGATCDDPFGLPLDATACGLVVVCTPI